MSGHHFSDLAGCCPAATVTIWAKEVELYGIYSLLSQQQAKPRGIVWKPYVAPAHKPFPGMHCNPELIQTLFGGAVCENTNVQSKMLRFPQHTILCHNLLRRHTSPKPNGIFPVGEATPDTNNLLLCATRVIWQLWTMSGPQSPDTENLQKTALYTRTHTHGQFADSEAQTLFK